MGSGPQSVEMRTCLTFLLTSLLVLASAKAPGGKGAKCDDGTKPTCADGSIPVRVKGQPPCPEGRPKTCADGSTPTGHGGHGGHGCPRHERICCDGSQPTGRGKNFKCGDGEKPVCSKQNC